MATFLDIVNKVRTDCGVGNKDLTTVVGANVEDRRIIGWVQDEWRDLQTSRPDWRWMREEFTFDTTAGQNEYSIATDPNFSHWRPNSFRAYLKSSGVGTERFLQHEKNFSVFRDTWLFNTRRTTQGMPVVVCIGPDNQLFLALVPDAVYTVVGEYFTVPNELVSNTDVPTMPARFHHLIRHLAAMRYGSFMSAPEVYSSAQRKASKLRSDLEFDQLPPITVAGSMF